MSIDTQDLTDKQARVAANQARANEVFEARRWHNGQKALEALELQRTQDFRAKYNLK